MREACPNDEEWLEAWPARGELAAHLASCAACRTRAESLQLDSALFEELRGVARVPDGPPAIPGYRVEEELSRGGQGVVYRAVQEATQREVALKVLAGRGALSARERRRFEREVELGSRLAHPGIVTLFDSGVSRGTPWYAMELVAGETLDAHVARARPALAERLGLFLELCAAVAHAHRSGVIHRDLKPGNVLVVAGAAPGAGRVRVLDFGTALPVAAGRVTVPGEFLGTLAYASPEQVSCGGEAGDTRSDVYSLGVVLYELVTGALPLDAEGSLSEVVQRIAHDTPPPASRRVPGIDRDLDAILAGALEKERERRYPSVEALARDVAHFLAHEPIERRARSAGYVLQKALRRHRRAALGGAAVLLIGSLLTFALARERLHARRAAEDAALLSGVFQDILGAAAPGRMGGDAPLRDVLALAAREIETGLAQAPDAQAAVQLTIGDTYRRLLMHGEAERHVSAALERFRVADGNGLETARCLEVLAQVLAAQGRPEAVPAAEEALAIRRARLGDGDARIAASERGLALALLAQIRDADSTRAEALLGSALARFRAALGDEHLEVAETRLVLARLADWQEGSEAEAHFDAALAAFERAAAAGGPTDPRQIECLTLHSAFLQARGRYDEAERGYARAEELTRALYGDELTSELLRRRARLAQVRGELADSLELARRALGFELRRWLTTRPGDEAEIEAVVAELERTPAVEAPFLDAFRLLRRFRGDGSFELAIWLNDLARVLVDDARADEAEELFREALNIRCRGYGADCPVRQQTLFRLGVLLEKEERAAEAVPLLVESVAIAERNGAERDAEEARRVLLRCSAGSEERP